MHFCISMWKNDLFKSTSSSGSHLFQGLPVGCTSSMCYKGRERLSVGLFKSEFVRGMLGKQQRQGSGNQNPEGSQ